MREEKGNSPKNARIKIDYSKIRPKVTFSYPSKNHQQEGSMLPTIFIVWTIISLIFLTGFSFATDRYNEEDVKEEAEYNLSDYDEFIIYAEESDLLKKTFETINHKITLKEAWEDAIEEMDFLPIFILLQTFIVSSLIYYPFKKYWSNIYPKYQGWRANKKIALLNVNDVQERNGEHYCEIPVFENIVLEYNATEDFSKYISLFEIEEHKFKYYLKSSKIKKILKKKNGKNELKRWQLNERIWYARFYFSQKPEKGKLEVIYK